MAKQLDDLTSATTANTAATQAAVAAIGTPGIDPALLTPITDQINANTKSITDALNPPPPAVPPAQ